jgi:DNA polymerase bacteriophage-type
LFISLPSGRKLKYIKARTDNGRIKYMGVRQVEGSSSKQWCEVDTFGGKVVENIVQAIARDCLMNSIQKLTYLGFEIDFHVHDEVIINAFKELKVETITEIMGEPIEWAPGLYLRAAGYECDFYMKD